MRDLFFSKTLSEEELELKTLDDIWLLLALLFIDLNHEWQSESDQMNSALFLLIRFLLSAHVTSIKSDLDAWGASTDDWEVAEFDRLQALQLYWSRLLNPPVYLHLHYRGNTGDARDPNVVFRSIMMSPMITRQEVLVRKDATCVTGFKVITKCVVPADDMLVSESSLFHYPPYARCVDLCATCHGGLGPKATLHCTMCQERYCSDKCYTEALRQGHDLFCEHSETVKLWLSFLGNMEHVDDTDEHYKHCKIMTFQLLVLAHQRSLKSVFELPYLHMFRRVTDVATPFEDGSHPSDTPSMMEVKLKCFEPRSNFVLFNKVFPLLTVSLLDFYLLFSLLLDHTDTVMEDNVLRTHLLLLKSFVNRAEDSAGNAKFYPPGLYGRQGVIAASRGLNKHEEVKLDVNVNLQG
jgi:hypothetical protein